MEPTTILERTNTNRLRERFGALAREWREQTRYSSSLQEKVLHPSYQSIIAMGPAVVPLVLEELAARRGHWAWALHFLTGADPAPGNASIDATREAWIEWGRHNGYLS